MKIVLAQGNPEQRYVRTRHNTGFQVLDALAEKEGVSWRSDSKFQAELTELSLAGEKVLLVKPTSYYNQTGLVARKLLDFYKLDPSRDLLVIHDELALPFGTLRIRERGSDAGNNGIKSLVAHLGDAFWRIRIGIAPLKEHTTPLDSVSFVLSAFSAEEAAHLQSAIIPHAISAIHAFADGTITPHSESSPL